jgi:cell division protein FtsB
MPERATPLAANPPDPRNGRGDGPDRYGLPDLSALPVIGFTRRRVIFIAAALLVAWIVISFARQVSQATDATGRLEQLQLSNARLANQVAALQQEYEQIQQPKWVEQRARGYGLGSDREIPFTLAAGAPSLPADAPGSAAVRLGADTNPPTALESWLTLLFGPDR